MNFFTVRECKYDEITNCREAKYANLRPLQNCARGGRPSLATGLPLLIFLQATVLGILRSGFNLDVDFLNVAILFLVESCTICFSKSNNIMYLPFLFVFRNLLGELLLQQLLSKQVKHASILSKIAQKYLYCLN